MAKTDRRHARHHDWSILKTGASSMASMKKLLENSVPPTHAMHACSLKSLFLKKDIVSVEIATSSHL